MGYRDDPDWAEDHGYYHWKCRDCGMSGWTDTTPDCACRNPITGKLYQDEENEISTEDNA